MRLLIFFFILTVPHDVSRHFFVLKAARAGEPITIMSAASQKYKVPLAVGWKAGDAARSLLQPPSTVGLQALLQNRMSLAVNSRRKM